MTKVLLISKLVLAGTILIFGSINFQACSPLDKKAELDKIDTLNQWLDEAENTMVIEEKSIQERHDSIDLKLEFIGENIKNMSREDQNLLTDYRAVRRAYNYYLQNYEGVRIEHDMHRERIENLEKDIRAGRIDEDEFEEIYEEESKVISQHKFEAQELISPVVQVEQMYQRTHNKVREMYLNTLAEQRANS